MGLSARLETSEHMMGPQREDKDKKRAPDDALTNYLSNHTKSLEPKGGGDSLEVKMYYDLLDTVQASLDGRIDKERIEACVSAVSDMLLKNPYSPLLLLFYTAASRGSYLAAHIANNVILAAGFGSSLGLSKDDLNDLGICAFGHDLGMAECAQIFDKKDQLNDAENKRIKEHPLKSAEMFRPHFSEKIIDGILDIHESVNGKGYPEGKTTEEISYLAKVVAICDVFEALTHPRSHRKELSPYEAMKLIIKKKDIIFDGRVVKRFLEFLSIFPVGSIVGLNTGEIAMVAGANLGSPTRPILKMILTPGKEVDSSGRVVNLLDDPMLYISGSVEPRDESEILHFLNPRGVIQL